MFKQFLLTISFYLFVTSPIIAQNSSLIIGNQKFISGGFSSLPIPTYDYGNTSMPNSGDPNMSYQGQTPTNASNLITTPNNEILFFIVDQHIYNKNGYCLGNLNTSSDDFNTTESFQIKGASEILIVPNPSNCQQYYIVSTKIENGIMFKRPYLFLLDMGIVNINASSYNSNECILGQLVPIGSYSGTYQNFGISISSLINNENTSTPFPPFINPSDPSPGKESNIFLGATPKDAQNNYFVFISNSNFIYRFKVSNFGFQFDNYVIPFLNNGNTENNAYYVRSELEVVRLSNGNIRIACPYFKSENQGNNTIWEWLFIAELDSYGYLIPNSTYHIPFYKGLNSTSSEDAALKGIEFSSNGNYLYISHSTNALQPNQLEYFNFNSPSNFLTPINIGNLDCKYSMLEKGIDNGIYFSGSSGLHKILNSDIPTSPIITLNTNVGFYNVESNGGATNLFSNLFKLYLLPDQIDGFNYYDNLNNNIVCCIENFNFDSDDLVNVTNDAIWNDVALGGSNPFLNVSGNIITIKKSIYIKPGVTLTIKNLNLKFAPNARIVVENGPINSIGGKLILDNATLSSVELCGINTNWLGCEVWGNINANQGLINSTNQGVLKMKNNSRIKDAQIGVLVGKRQTTTTNTCPYFEIISDNIFVPINSGGVIEINNSTLENNLIGVQFEKYFSPNGMNNTSIISKTLFEWNDNIISASLNYHLRLNGIKGVRIIASIFTNNILNNTNLTQSGIGIYSRNSNFSVESKCNYIPLTGVNCNDYTPSEFRNLKFGINTFSTDILNFTVNRAKFIDNEIGAFILGTMYYQITESKFQIPELNNTYTAGIYNFGGKGFKIEENDFFEEDGKTIGMSYGTVINNSGVTYNEVYKNFYQNLNVGCYAMYKNGTQLNIVTNPISKVTNGLHWICNDFRSEITTADIGIVGSSANPGIIDYHQGYYGGTTLYNAVKSTARNTFSMYSELSPIEHDIKLDQYSQQMNYVYLNTPTQSPDNVSPGVYTTMQYFNNSPVTGYGFNACPSKLLLKPTKQDVHQLKVKLDSLQAQIDGGSTESLLNLLANSQNPYLLLGELSPYLSDSTLKEYLFSCASTLEKKELLELQKPLSPDLCQDVMNSLLPELVKLELILNQGDAPMQKLFSQISEVKSLLDGTYSQYVGNLLSDTVLSYQNLKDSLIAINIDDARKDLIYLMISHNEYDSVGPIINEICECESDFLMMTAINDRLQSSTSYENLLSESSQFADSVNSIYCLTLDPSLKAILNSLINNGGNMVNSPEFLDFDGVRSLNQNFSINDDSKDNIVNVFPIPSNGEINLKSNEIISDLKIKIFDVKGNLVYTNNFKETIESQIDLSNLSNGEYVIELILNDLKHEKNKIIIKK